MSVERATPGAPEWPGIGPPHLARYLFAAERCAGARVLDAACGAGYGASLLKERGASAVYAFDRDAAVVRAAAERYPEVSFSVADCEEMSPPSQPFDLVVCFEAIEHLERPERFLRVAAQALGKDGLLILSTPDRAAAPPYRAGRPANPFHVREWHAGEFSGLLSNYFAEVDLRVQVKAHSVAAREAAIVALRQRLTLGNPLVTWLWRRLARSANGARRWRELDGLALGGPADFPIVNTVLADLFGTPCFLVALCSRPRGSLPSGLLGS